MAQEADRQVKQKRSDAELKARSHVNHIEQRLNEKYEFDGGCFDMARERDRFVIS